MQDSILLIADPIDAILTIIPSTPSTPIRPLTCKIQFFWSFILIMSFKPWYHEYHWHVRSSTLDRWYLWYNITILPFRDTHDTHGAIDTIDTIAVEWIGAAGLIVTYLTRLQLAVSVSVYLPNNEWKYTTNIQDHEARHKIDNSKYVTNLFCLFFKMYETIRRFKPKAADYKSITAYPPLITLTFFFFSISFFFFALTPTWIPFLFSLKVFPL